VSVFAANGLAAVLVVSAAAIAVLEPARLRLGNVAFPVKILFAAFAAFSLASTAWSPDPTEGIDGWLRVVVAAYLGLLLVDKAGALDAGARRRVETAFIAGFCVGLVVLAVQIVTANIWDWDKSLATLWSSPGTYYWALFNRTATVYAILLPFAVSAVVGRYGRLAGALLAFAGALAVFRLNSKAAELAVAIGIAAAAAAWLLGRRRTAPLLGAALAALLLAAPLLASSDIMARTAARRDITVSVYHRAAIWQHAAGLVAEKPLFGWGMHAARTMPKDGPDASLGAEILPLHPHNGALHLWLELGAVGALLGAALVGWLGLRAGTWPRAAALAAALTVASISYGLWQGWWMACLWLAAALARALPDPDRADGPGN
jgi:O-antigen ligase